MRIRIVQKPTIESMDGVRLDRFEVGQEYELGSSLGCVLLAEGWGEPADQRPGDSSPPAQPKPDDRANPPNLIRERHPPYLDRLPPGVAAEFDRRRRQ